MPNTLNALGRVKNSVQEVAHILRTEGSALIELNWQGEGGGGRNVAGGVGCHCEGGGAHGAHDERAGGRQHLGGNRKPSQSLGGTFDFGSGAPRGYHRDLVPGMTSEERKMTLWACQPLGAKVPAALRKYRTHRVDCSVTPMSTGI